MSDSFLTKRGVRQGCPLSSSLLLWCIELLSNYINKRKEIIGVKIDDQETKQTMLCDVNDFIAVMLQAEVKYKNKLNSSFWLNNMTYSPIKTPLFEIIAKKGGTAQNEQYLFFQKCFLSQSYPLDLLNLIAFPSCVLVWMSLYMSIWNIMVEQN